MFWKRQQALEVDYFFSSKCDTNEQDSELMTATISSLLACGVTRFVTTQTFIKL